MALSVMTANKRRERSWNKAYRNEYRVVDLRKQTHPSEAWED
jgi:hypothetical protein